MNALIGSIAVGLFAAAVLMVNNIRDIETDTLAKKKTLAVKVGRRPAKAIYFLMIWLPMLVLVPYSLIYPATFFTWAVLFLLIPATLIVATAKTPGELILALKLTSFASLLYAVLFGLGLAQINFAL